jgi:CRP/FNR family transcriptional regulator, nitrogen fixation regulation protein
MANMFSQTAIAPAAGTPLIPIAAITCTKGSHTELSFFASHPGLLGTAFSYGKDEEIYGDGEPAEYVYEVMSGAVRTCKLLDDGRRQIGAFHLPGDVFGLESGPNHRLTADAVIDTTVRIVRRRSLEAAARNNIQVANALWALTARDLRHAEDHMLLLGRKTASERVATFVLEMDRRLTVAGMIELPMCRRDIGDYLGLTLETISRVLSQFQSEGMLGLSGARHIMLRNRQRLRGMNI